jgi:hypothetical protein
MFNQQKKTGVFQHHPHIEKETVIVEERERERGREGDKKRNRRKVFVDMIMLCDNVLNFNNVFICFKTCVRVHK